MLIHDLHLNKVANSFKIDTYNNKYYYFIVCTPKELKDLKEALEIDEVTFEECLEFDDNMKLDLFEKYDFISLNTFELKNEKLIIEEVNMYLADRFILIVINEDHFLYGYIEELIKKKINTNNPVLYLYKMNYLIFKKIMLNAFDNLELVEDMILDIEDKIMKRVCDDHVNEINEIRNMTRIIVKNTRPLLYIGDRILKENIRYMKSSDYKKHKLENLQGIDFGIEKLYSFAISTRELADKLLDIYSSQIAEKTNSLITKLTILTGIASPLTIITGIYGMNFKFMPELNYLYGYPFIILIMISIVITSLVILKLKKLF